MLINKLPLHKLKPGLKIKRAGRVGEICEIYDYDGDIVIKIKWTGLRSVGNYYLNDFTGEEVDKSFTIARLKCLNKKIIDEIKRYPRT
jgi:hypothetical protein